MGARARWRRHKVRGAEGEKRSDGRAGGWKQGFIGDGEDGRVIEGRDGRWGRESKYGGGRREINAREDGKSWVGLIVIDKGDSGADSDVHGGVVALRASRIGEAEGAEGGRPRTGESCSRAAPAGDSEVKRRVCSTRRSRIGVPRENGRGG